MRSLEFVLSILFVASAQATTQTPTQPPVCSPFRANIQNLNVQRLHTANDECWVTLTPEDSYVDLKYRDYTFTDNGLFMIFNSYGDGPDSTMTGAREFYFFPRKNKVLEVESKPDQGTYAVKMTNDKWVTFQTKSADVEAIEGAQLKVDTRVDPENDGGVQIVSYPSVYLDCGYRRGASPSGNPYRFSNFIDQQNQKCRVQNQYLFEYDADGDQLLKSDDELQEVYQRFCPHLKTPFPG